MVFGSVLNTILYVYLFLTILNCVLKTIFEKNLNRFNGKLLSKGFTM